MLIRYLEKLGRYVINGLELFGAVMLLVGQTIYQLRHRPRLKHAVSPYGQCYGYCPGRYHRLD